MKKQRRERRDVYGEVESLVATWRACNLELEGQPFTLARPWFRGSLEDAQLKRADSNAQLSHPSAHRHREPESVAMANVNCSAWFAACPKISSDSEHSEEGSIVALIRERCTPQKTPLPTGVYVGQSPARGGAYHALWDSLLATQGDPNDSHESANGVLIIFAE